MGTGAFDVSPGRIQRIDDKVFLSSAFNSDAYLTNAVFGSVKSPFPGNRIRETLNRSDV
jgi:hypothetical protein